MKHLRGEHTFWPWVKKNPTNAQVEKTLAAELTRVKPRMRIVRWCRYRLVRQQNEVLQILNDI
jgi:hypothetical protein